jgi:hypothetical protein
MAAWLSTLLAVEIFVTSDLHKSDIVSTMTEAWILLSNP